MHTDSIKIHPADAVKATVHHLKLAALFWEVCPEEEHPLLAEMARELDKGTTLPAARAWHEALTKAYEQMDHDPAEE